MNPYLKQPLTFQEQIKWLENNALSKPEDRVTVTSILRYIGFSRFMSYYQIYTGSNIALDPDFSFKNVINDYIADQKLRLLLLEGVERIEVAIRCLWTEAMVSQGGAFVHLDSQYFYSHVKNNKGEVEPAYSSWLMRISKEIRRSHDEEITTYFKNYSTDTHSLPPLWKSVNAMSLGSVSYGIRYTAKNAIKKKVALDLGMPNNPKYLESFLIALSTLRNVCAHHGRLWSQPLSASMMSTKELPIDTGSKGMLYPVLWWMCAIIRHMSPDSEWPNRLSQHCQNHFKDWQLQKAMGFPKDWDSF